MKEKRLTSEEKGRLAIALAGLTTTICNIASKKIALAGLTAASTLIFVEKDKVLTYLKGGDKQ